MTVVRVGEALLPRVAELFDDYRQHYGQPPAPRGTSAWLRHSGLLLFAAMRDERPCGLVTVLPMPASLRLGVFWAVRDLWVPAAERRRGLGRALLRHVIEAARREGAVRVSLQTESGNAAALALYASLGFTPVGGLELLGLPLVPDG